MNKKPVGKAWQTFSIAHLIVIGVVIVSGRSAIAQVIPDNTLGNESSVVNPRDETSDSIDGGAIRGQNLFHSFQEFNVDAGRGVYFANPDGIANIMSRVTGGNVSNILGTLGVDGAANLFLINPNGILFGKNASLNITGSFFATTADGLELGENGFFSATQPQQSSLLSVNPGAFFYNQVASQPGNIINQAVLVTGEDLTIDANNLDLQGQILAGRDLTLFALDTVKIRDTVTNPFIANAQGNLLIQGNETLDIFALNHPNSGLFSGSEMVLRSTNPVGGDAHFTSGGSFRVEQLDESLGGLFSPNDPIIRASGDVALDSYTGASLHIFAGGSVTIPNFIQIQSADTVEGIVETVTLSDSETTININGSTQPTLDIRAGTTAIGTPNIDTAEATSADINLGTILFTDADSNRISGTVLLTNQYQPNPELDGNIQLSATQENLASQTGGLDSGGIVAIDSKGSISVDGAIEAIASSTENNEENSSLIGNGGEITFIAEENISFESGSTVLSTGLLGGGITLKSDATISATDTTIESNSLTSTSGLSGKDINIRAKSLFLDNGAVVANNTSGQANSGNINVEAVDNITINGLQETTRTSLQSNVKSGANADGGDININTNSLSLNNGSQILTIVRGTDGISLPANGNAGKINISVEEAVSLDKTSNLNSRLDVEATGRSGDIELKAKSLTLANTSQIVSSTFGEGDAGNIDIDVIKAVNIDGVASGIQSNVESGGVGDGGNINIKADSLSMTNVAQIQTIVRQPTQIQVVLEGPILNLPAGQGNAGNIIIETENDVSLAGFVLLGETTFGTSIASLLGFGATGKAGNIQIKARSLSLDNGAQLTAGTFGEGDGGNIIIQTDDIVSLSGRNTTIFSNVDFGGNGDAGDINIQARSLSLAEGAQIVTSVRGILPELPELPAGSGNGGNIIIEVEDDVNLTGFTTSIIGNQLALSSISSNLQFGAVGRGGDINIKASSVSLSNGSQLNASTAGEGDAGNIQLDVTDTITLSETVPVTIEDNIPGGFSSGIFTNSLETANGKGGNISIVSNGLRLLNGATLNASTRSNFTGGNIQIDASFLELIDGGQIVTTTFSDGNAGNIIAKVTDETKISGFDPSFDERRNQFIANFGEELASVNIGLVSSKSGLFGNTTPSATGEGGDIIFQTNSLILDNNAEISASSEGQGNAGDINISLNSLKTTDSNVTTAANRTAGGAINIKAKDINLRGNSNVTTDVNSGVGGGGDITLTADSIIAFDDSDIFAFAQDGQGGNITLDTPVFFGENFTLNSLTSDPNNLEGNSRVDINATGAVSGVVDIPDVSFIQNSLTELPDNAIDTDELVANSCVVRSREQNGTFIITGSGGFSLRPGEAGISDYPTGKVRNVPNTESKWRSGEPIVEPQGLYRLTNGKLVLSRECP